MKNTSILLYSNPSPVLFPRGTTLGFYFGLFVCYRLCVFILLTTVENIHHPLLNKYINKYIPPHTQHGKLRKESTEQPVSQTHIRGSSLPPGEASAAPAGPRLSPEAGAVNRRRRGPRSRHWSCE